MVDLEAVLTNVPYWDKSSNRIIQRDLNSVLNEGISTAKVQQEIWCRVSTSAQVANNYAIPVWVDLYALECIGDHSISVGTAFDDGLIAKSLGS